MKKETFGRAQYWLLIVYLVAALSSCKGSQGDVGPQGTAGVPGAQGPQGTQGVPGTANLIVSSWTSVAATSWKSDNDPLYFYTGFEDKNVTQTILDKGSVMAYYRNPSQKSVVIPLPSVTDKVSIGYFFQVDQGKGFVNFDLSFFQPRKTPIDFDIEVRWVIIPPNPGGRLKAIDWTNYEDVKHTLMLLD